MLKFMELMGYPDTIDGFRTPDRVILAGWHQSSTEVILQHF